MAHYGCSGCNLTFTALKACVDHINAAGIVKLGRRAAGQHSADICNGATVFISAAHPVVPRGAGGHQDGAVRFGADTDMEQDHGQGSDSDTEVRRAATQF